ncbi:hypothetical protein SPURM210S_08171 [Streptomyces purpurascens]
MDEAAAVPDEPRSPGGPGRGGGEGRVRTGDTGRMEDALTVPLIAAVRDLGDTAALSTCAPATGARWCWPW